MGRIITPITVANALDPSNELRCDALVDTGTAGLVLPNAWKGRLGVLPGTRVVELELANQQVVPGEICGPVRIQIEGFDPIYSEVTFMDMHPENGRYEPLIGYIILGQSRAAVDMVGHRLVLVKHVDLKAA